MGNLSVQPDLNLEKIKVADIDLLILPGGNAWEQGGNMEISQLTKEAFHQGRPIAAICAATVFLAKQGLYGAIKHTSNGLEYLKKQVAEYDAEYNYVNLPCVADKNVITANGAAMIEFAHKIFEHFGIFKKEELKYWLTLYKSEGMMH
jgi:putative intracellular protease/amidase